MRPSVITAAESTGSSPFARSTVRIVSTPSPEKDAARRTWRHWTSGRGVPAFLPARLIRYDGSHRATFVFATTLWFFFSAASIASGEPSAGWTNGRAVGRGRAGGPQLGWVGDVDLAQHGLRRPVRHHPRRQRRERLDPGAAVGE